MSLSPVGAAPVHSDFPPLTVALPASTDAVGAPAPSSATCANCLAPLVGTFCSECGAPRVEDRPLTVHRFVGDLWTELTSVDSATIRSLRALVLEPGRLTREYLDGRTRWYLSPLRFFLLATSLTVFVGAASGHQQRLIDTMREKSVVQQTTTRRAEKAGAAPIPAKPATTARKPLTPRQLRQKAILRRFKPEAMMAALMDNIAAIFTSPWLQVGYPLAVAAALGIVLRRKRRNYAEHFVHALHFMTFSALLSAALIPLRLMQPADVGFFNLVTLLYWLVAGRYFFRSVRRIYADSVPRSVVDTALFAVTAQSSMMVLPFAVMFVTVLWLLGTLAVRLLLA